MSGLATEEALIQEGRIKVLVGQGQTAEVLRNLCYRVYSKDDKNETHWQSLVAHIKNLFGVTLNKPRSLLHRGTIAMDYCDQDGKTTLDLSSSGRGMQQVLLLLAHLYDNSENTVFLLDEPDAHLEILRQRQIYNLIVDAAERKNSQIISASHSEILLGEAAQRESAIAFVGKPHILGKNKQSNVISALKEIGFEYYHAAERMGWILYLEGESDLRILQAFARHLKHPAEKILQNPLVKYLETNLPHNARKHFYNLREAKNNLVGILLLDRIEKSLQNEGGLLELMWCQREIENYLCNRTAITNYVVRELKEDLFDYTKKEEQQQKMKEEITKLERAIQILGNPAPFSKDIKASDDFLTPLFKNFLASASPNISDNVPSYLLKRDFHKLVPFIPNDEIDLEVEEKLNEIMIVAQKAKPNTE